MEQAKSLAEDILQWIDEYDMDHDQYKLGEGDFEAWVLEQCKNFVQTWRANIVRNTGSKSTNMDEHMTQLLWGWVARTDKRHCSFNTSSRKEQKVLKRADNGKEKKTPTEKAELFWLTFRKTHRRRLALRIANAPTTDPLVKRHILHNIKHPFDCPQDSPFSSLEDMCVRYRSIIWLDDESTVGKALKSIEDLPTHDRASTSFMRSVPGQLNLRLHLIQKRILLWRRKELLKKGLLIRIRRDFSVSVRL